MSNSSRDRHPLVERGAVAELVAEQRHDAHVVLRAAGHGRVDDLLEDHQQALAGMAERVEAPALISDSMVRLLSTWVLTRSQKS